MGITSAEGAEQVRVAFVGAGAMAYEHARAFADIAGVKLAGIFSRTRANAEYLASRVSIPIVCGSVSELFERTGSQLVVVAVSPSSIKEVALECFAFPWCVLLEKPPGINWSEAVCLKEEGDRKRRKVLVALNRRFYSSTRCALGDLSVRRGNRHIHVLDQQSTEFAASLGHDKKTLDHWHYCASIHLIDYIRLFGRGSPLVTQDIPWDCQDGAVVVAHIRFDSGDTAIYECIWSGPGPWAVTVTTAGRRWEMRPLENAVYQDAGTRSLVPTTIHSRDVQFKPGFRLQAEHAIFATRGLQSECPTLDEAIESVHLVKSIYENCDR